MDNIHDYLDEFPDQYTKNREKYEQSMDKFYEDAEMLSQNKYGKSYYDLDVFAKKDIESMIENKSARQGSSDTVYQLDNGKVVGEEEAKKYQENYGNMMDQVWEEYKRKRDGSGRFVSDRSYPTVSKIVTDRLTK